MTLAAAFAGIGPDEAERAAGVAEALLRDGGWIAPLLAPLVAALAADPGYQPPWRVARDPLRTGATLFEAACGTLTATVTNAAAMRRRPAPASVAFSCRLAVTRYHRAGGASLRRWRWDGESLRALDALPLEDGMVAILDGRRHAHQLAGATGDVVTITFVTRGAGVAHERALDDGRLLRRAMLDEEASRTRMALTLLRHLGRADAGPAFDAATRAGDPALRWDAMREWLATDAAAAAPRLRVMARADADAAVRDAAAAALPLLEAPCRA